MNTFKVFDYNLWTTEENGTKKNWAQVKTTGEVCEVDLSVMRLLRKEEKALRRKIAEKTENGTVLSLDSIAEEENSGA